MIKYVCDMCGKEEHYYNLVTLSFDKTFGSSLMKDKHLCPECFKKLTTEILINK